MNAEQTLSLVRTILKFLGGFAVSAGIFSTSTAEGVVGAVVTLLAAVWSWYTHKEISVPAEAIAAMELKPGVEVKVDPSNPPSHT